MNIDICTICHMSDGIITRGNGIVHHDDTIPNRLCQPVHKACFKKWLEIHGTICHICRRSIYVSAMFTWRDRTIMFIAPMTRPMLTGIASRVAVTGDVEQALPGMASGMLISGFTRLTHTLLDRSVLRQINPEFDLRTAAGVIFGGLTTLSGSIIILSKFLGWSTVLERFRQELSRLNTEPPSTQTFPFFIMATLGTSIAGASLGGWIGQQNNQLIIQTCMGGDNRHCRNMPL